MRLLVAGLSLSPCRSLKKSTCMFDRLAHTASSWQSLAKHLSGLSLVLTGPVAAVSQGSCKDHAERMQGSRGCRDWTGIVKTGGATAEATVRNSHKCQYKRASQCEVWEQGCSAPILWGMRLL